jgi:formate dehydrogenase assembly factor FdhD
LLRIGPRRHLRCTGTVLLTSRLFVEAVQKAAVMDVPALIAVSAPSGRPGRHLATQT